MDEECKEFSNSESSAFKVLLSNCLIFYQFEPGVSYKSDAYKTKRVMNEGEKMLRITMS